MVYETYTPMYSEIFQKVHGAKNKESKIKVLQKYRTEQLEMFLNAALNPNIEWLLPAGNVPFKANEAPDGEGEGMRLSAQVRTLHHYVKMNRDHVKMEPVIGNPQINRTKREMMFIQMLEGLHKDEAKLVLLAKDKNLNKEYKGLNASTVTEAYGWDEHFQPM